MAITLNGTTGITTPDITSEAGLTVDGVSFASGAPANTLVTTSGGNVGIGVAPTAVSGFGANKLLEMGGASVPALIFRPSGSTSEHTVLGAGDGLVIGATGAATASNNAIRFFTSNTNSSNTPTERARIDSSGNLLVGTTSPNNSSSIGLTLTPDGGISFTTSNTGTQFPCAFRRGGNLVGIIRTDTTTTSYVTSSDYRLKEDWVSVADASTRVNALKPVNFAWKVDGKRVDGFLAHELAEVVPEAVTGEKDAVDAEGNPVYQGIDQSKLVPLLTAALQEALGKIETLEARVAALEAA